MSLSKSVSLLIVAARPLTRPLLAVVLASVFVAGSAVAQTRAPAAVASTVASGAVKGQPTAITYKQKTTFDFDDDPVEGSVVQPDFDVITGRSKSQHESLVRARVTFQPEMLKSVESL